MNKLEMPKAFEAKDHEDRIYRMWQESGAFNPDNSNGEPFAVMMPPPNVTGVLHLGHALENSIMDIMARYQRLKGKKVLVLPGTDHAAVATQAKVEKILMESGVKNPRQELGREQLLQKIREYAEGSKATIISQVKRMGTSCDWSRLAYTFDEARSRAVNEVFIRMYNDGLVYRGYRVVNWTVAGQSTCSDDELEYRERKAKLYYFKYSQDFPITIASTRPETKLGDTAVAVNPKDERYARFIGREFTAEVGALAPLHIKIIADENVDPAFGTGALGVTPAHSMIDHEMWARQKAEGDPIGFVAVIGPDGRMTPEAGKEYEGLTAEAAREKFVRWLEANDLLEKTEETVQNVAMSDRFKDAIESIPMTQWFVDVNKAIPGRGKTLKQLMREAVTIGHGGDAGRKITITPERFEKSYLDWIDHLRDWCVSRQIWWGHRIPAWFRGDEIVIALERPEGEGWVADEDTLDTWFSSGLWTFSTLGWPEETADLKTFHPTAWMQMGYEILFFWMARMILMTTYALDTIPFRDVYIHGMLRDERGEKFSKSSGNNLDPIEVADKYGTDALRLSLVLGIAPGNDSKYYEEKIEGARNLVNKLWNISRYIIGGDYDPKAAWTASELTLGDRWVLGKMRDLIRDVTADLDRYQFSQAAERLREFTWSILADWYLEASKFEQSPAKSAVLGRILADLLRLWHPFAPFVTEAIWSELGRDTLLITERWPDIDDYEAVLQSGGGERFELILDAISAIRNARAEAGIRAGEPVRAIIAAADKADLVRSHLDLIKRLRTGLSEIEVVERAEAPAGAIYVFGGLMDIYLLVESDGSNRERLEKDLAEARVRLQAVEALLSDDKFRGRAPVPVVEKEEQRRTELQAAIAKLETSLR